MAERKGRLTAKVRTAIEEIVLRGRNRADAAQIAGMAEDSLYRAMRRPETLAYRTLLLEVLRSGASARTLAKIESLMDCSTSEHVKLQAAQWLAGIDGIVPVQRGEVHHTHSHVLPGLHITFTDWKPHIIEGVAHTGEEGRVIGTPRPYPGTEGLPVRTPHPSEESA